MFCPWRIYANILPKRFKIHQRVHEGGHDLGASDFENLVSLHLKQGQLNLFK